MNSSINEMLEKYKNGYPNYEKELLMSVGYLLIFDLCSGKNFLDLKKWIEPSSYYID
jgi:hypothetical protein